jgi:uncharacterized protein YciI
MADCFVVEATYAPDAAETRKPHREAHLDRVRKLAGEGALVLAGAYEDLSASLLVFELENEDAVRAVIETDVYLEQGVWSGYRIKRLSRIV